MAAMSTRGTYNPPVPITRVLPAVIVLLLASPAAAQSVFTTRLDDPSGVSLTSEAFGARGDGVADDSLAIQKAIDQAAATPNGGVLFIPPGRNKDSRFGHHTLYMIRTKMAGGS